MPRYQEFVLGLLVCVLLVLLFLFLVLNWAMGCETWDQSLWTASNSCVTPTEFINLFIPN